VGSGLLESWYQIDAQPSIGPEMGEGNAGICEYVSKMGDDRIKESGQKKDSAQVILTRTLALNMQAACKRSGQRGVVVELGVTRKIREAGRAKLNTIDHGDPKRGTHAPGLSMKLRNVCRLGICVEEDEKIQV